MSVFWGISLLITLAMVLYACKQNNGKVNVYWLIAFGIEILLFVAALVIT